MVDPVPERNHFRVRSPAVRVCIKAMEIAHITRNTGALENPIGEIAALIHLNGVDLAGHRGKSHMYVALVSSLIVPPYVYLPS